MLFQFTLGFGAALLLARVRLNDGSLRSLSAVSAAGQIPVQRAYGLRWCEAQFGERPIASFLQFGVEPDVQLRGGFHAALPPIV